jgi:hypothetical protein
MGVSDLDKCAEHSTYEQSLQYNLRVYSGRYLQHWERTGGRRPKLSKLSENEERELKQYYGTEGLYSASFWIFVD